jgi:hypothetical protein
LPLTTVDLSRSVGRDEVPDQNHRASIVLNAVI